MADWVRIAEGWELDIPRENIEGLAPVLDGLIEAFRPLTAELSLIPDE